MPRPLGPAGLLLLLTPVAALTALGPGPSANAQGPASAAKAKAKAKAEAPAPSDAAADSAEERREKQAAERFLSLLEKNPRRGTALDRVYGYHVERGTLDGFVKTYQDRVAKDAGDGDGWLILGLLESQRGRDAAAVEALRKAESNRADDPLPSFYLGQALVLVGQPEEAAAAFERALERKPKRNDLLEIFQALGKVYQRSQKTKEAMAVWERLEALFPGDARVREQIASAMAEEGQADLALPRFEELARAGKDPFRQAQLAMTAADLKVRLGKTGQALGDFESLLGKLRPDSWLYKEVRRKIEEVFLRNDDQAGLATYYERWVKKNPEDVEALVRLGRSLAGQGRVSEARPWYEQAIKLAPSRRDLRLALIGQLSQDQKYAEAAAQYEALDKAEPNNPDTLRDWGGLLLRDKARPEAERKAAAAAVWRRLLDARPKDAVTAAQVADLFRQADMPDDALALYRKAIGLAPADPQYREYLGEYLHNLKRPAEALAEWRQIAAGKNRDAKSLQRLGEVLAGFGYLDEAIPPTTEAADLDKNDFNLRLKLAELLHKAEKLDDARAQLDVAERLAENDEEKSAALEAQVKNDLAGGKVGERVGALRKELDDAGAEATAPRWARLARYLEADGKLPEAKAASDRAIEADPRSVPAWTLAARVRESAGQLADAADAFRRLAEVDRRNRTEYLTGVAKLEARMGRVEPALKAGRDLIAAAPGNPEHYEFFSQLCFQLGRNDEGLDALRRAARVNPNETKIVLTLAETLAGQFRTDEAVEMYWRAFEKSPDLDAKIGVVSRLTELYLQRNQFDRLLGRLQREQNEAQAQQQREIAVCLAQAYATSGDLGMARSELERLLSANARDTQLLKQLSKLAEEEGDLESSAKYQKQLVDLAPSDEESFRLAQLYVRFGEFDEAQTLWTKMASGQTEIHRVFQAIDNLLANDKPKPVLDVTEAMVRKDPRDWEALYREGVALARLDKPEAAARAFRSLLDLRLEDDAKSAIVKARRRDPKLQATGARVSSRTAAVQATPLEDRVNAVQTIRMAAGLESRAMGQGRTVSSWAPPDFGQARMAALGWLISLSQKESKAAGDKVVASLRPARPAGKDAGKGAVDPRPYWDWYYVCAMRNENREAYDAARDLSRAAPGDPTAAWVFLTAMGGRQFGSGPRYVTVPGRNGADATPPLPAEELDDALASYRNLRQRRPDLVQAQVIGNVAAELKRAKRDKDDDALYRESVDAAEQASQVNQVASVLSLAGQRGDVDGLIRLFDKYERLQQGQTSGAFAANGFYFSGAAGAVGQAMAVRASEKAYADVLKLLDHDLAVTRKRQEQAAQRGRPQRSGFSPAVGSVYNYSVWTNPKTTTYARLNFPVPNEYYDNGAITVLRNAYELYKRADLLSDLTAHFRGLADAAPTPADALYPRLALSYLLWWEDDKDGSIAEFAKVAGSAKAESDLRLVLAELYEQRGEPAEALGLVDDVQPLDNATMQRREEQALRLAVTTGNLERARQAAERLFGLRLDTDTQVRLAGQMHQLGMHELAESVLGRARRRAGGKAAALVGLMLQYQRQDKSDVAVQVALQILRSTSGLRVNNPNVYNPNDPDAARDAAVQVLARSGRIKGMIEKVREQIARAPGAVQLRQALADYYKADNQRDKARAELEKIAELRPDDALLRYQIANQLAQDGKPAESLPHFRAALAKDPTLIGRNYYQVQNAFQQAGKMDEMADMLESVDIRALGQSFYVPNLIQNLANDPKLKPRMMTLFKKAWEAFPQERLQLISSMRGDDFWQLPDSYEFARQALVPDPSSVATGNQWNPVTSFSSYGNDGRVNGVLSHVLDQAAARGKLDELGGQIEASLAKTPGWTPGKVILALIRVRSGRTEEGRALVKALLDKVEEEAVPSDALWVVGGELENHVETRDLALTVYEACLKTKNDNNPFSTYNYQYSPVRRLVYLYDRAGRKEDVRRALLGFSNPRDLDNNNSYPDGYLSQLRLNGLTAAADELIKLGFTADAIPMLGEAVVASESVDPNGPNYIGNLDALIKQARDGLSEALQGLEGEQLAGTVTHLLDPDGGDKPGADGDAGKGAATPKPARRDQAVDLAMLVHPRELDKTAVRSLLAESIAASAKDPGSFVEVEATLRSLRDRHPDDLSVRIASTLAAVDKGDADGANAGLTALREFAEAHPLEPLPAGARANARQRAEAARRLGLWLVAQACWDREPLRDAADAFADLAVEAARRQTDTRWALAMLRERGRRALDRGDEAGADAAWSRMLEIVLAREAAKARKAAEAPAPTPRPENAPAAAKGAVKRTSYQPPTPVPPAPPAPAPPAGARPAQAPAAGVPILTVDRFEQAMQLAKLAAENGRFALGLRAVRESLEGGPPVPVAPKSNNRNVVVRRGGDQEPVDQVSGKVVARFAELEGVWRNKGASPGSVYEALRDVVMPRARPTEVFLYAPPLNAANVRRPTSVGSMLADWAVRAGKADDLRKRVAERRGEPLAELAASVLLSQLETAGGTTEGANAALADVAEKLKKNTLRSSAELACHAALPALARDETADKAVAVIKLALVSLQAGTNTNGQTEPLASILTAVGRRQLERGDVEGGKTRFNDYLDAVARGFTNYIGDYPIYQRKLAMARIASEYARAGLWADSLEELGRLVDTPAREFGEVSTGGSLGRVHARLKGEPAKDRYERLKAWTLPTESRRTVRILASVGSLNPPPAAFAGAKKDGRAAPPVDDDEVVSTASDLVEAAREAGTLDALAGEAAEAARQNVENAQALVNLIEVARDRRAEVAPKVAARTGEIVKETESRAEEARQNPNNGMNKPLAFPWIDYLLARATLSQPDPALRDLGMKLIEALLGRAKSVGQWNVQPRLLHDLAAAKAAREGSEAVPAQPDGGLADWHPMSTRAGFAADGSTPPWWVASDGVVSHLAGPGSDFLLLDYPLAGTFEVSVDAFQGGHAESGYTYGGLVVEPDAGWGGGQVYGFGNHDQFQLGGKLVRKEVFNRLTVRSGAGKVSYLVNGHLVHEDEAAATTSPWLGLYSSRERRAAWRNLTVKGSPEIPREVRLAGGDRLDGWVSSYYNETQPRRRTAFRNDRNGNQQNVSIRSRRTGARGKSSRVAADVGEFDWSAAGGEIRGRRDLSTSPRPRFDDGPADDSAAAQSRLYYARPLRDGDELAYEFLDEPGQTFVHPAMDRLAFLLDPKGVRLHWMTAPSGDTSALPADNAADEPGNRRGPAELPLKPGEWNAVKVALRGSTVALELNGVVVYERPLEASNGRQFGFYHDKGQTAARARNVVLRGRWPGSFTDALRESVASFTPADPGTEADRRVRRDLIGEALFALGAGEALRRAREAGPEKGYAILADWVLPKADRPAFRVSGEFTPTATEAPGDPPSKPPGDGRRSVHGGEIDSPATALVDAAEAAGKLDDLASLLDADKTAGEVNGRARLALVALAAAARGDDAKAADALAELKPLLEKVPANDPEWSRWPELVAADRAVRRPALRDPALGLLEVMVDQSQKKSPTPVWEHQVKNLRARGRLLAEGKDPAEAFGTEARVGPWAAVTQTRAETRGTGEPRAAWTFRDGAFTHLPGHATDLLYLGVPLRGDFQVDCELTSFGWREAYVGYAGLVVGPKHDLKNVQRSTFGRGLADVPVSPPLEKLDDWYKYRLVVKNGSMTSFVNGRQIYQAAVPVERDPWLALFCYPQITGGIRNLKISGTPSVPETLNLSVLPDLSGWLADEYGDSSSGDNPDWDKRGDEIHASRRDESPGIKQESTLRYNRPMLEDGEIAYEFYYEPGEAMAHPALGRLALLLEPDGVKVHRLTDGPYERTGLAPDNAEPDPESRKGAGSVPLKKKDWNRAAVSIAGDRLTVSVNGEPVYERALPASNSRAFALFHYADETEVRVRNVTYRGNWPRALPADLAGPADPPKPAAPPEPAK